MFPFFFFLTGTPKLFEGYPHFARQVPCILSKRKLVRARRFFQCHWQVEITELGIRQQYAACSRAPACEKVRGIAIAPHNASQQYCESQEINFWSANLGLPYTKISPCFLKVTQHISQVNQIPHQGVQQHHNVV